MGHETIQTPNLDRLAREGVTFRRGYVPTALCRPSLATMITGLYPHQHKISGNDPAIPESFQGNPRANADYMAKCEQLIAKIDQCETLPEMLSQAGYKSFQSGKWWEGNHSRGGFDEGMTHGDPKRGGRHGDVGLKIGREGLDPVYDFIDECGNDPWFVWYAPFLPHTPHTPPQRLLEKYEAEGKPLALARYHAMCDWFDETCGQLMEHVDGLDTERETLIVYVTDNGWIQRTPQSDLPEGWSRGFAPRSKQTAYEGGVRTPIIFRWPEKLKPRMDESSLVSSIDLVPTILAAAGIESHATLPGLNLMPVLEGGELTRDVVFGEGFAHDVANVDRPSESLLNRWCIEGKWKLIQFHDGKIGRYPRVHQREIVGPELYDLENDPHEKNNLAEAHPEIVERLTKRLNDWWQPETE